MDITTIANFLNKKRGYAVDTQYYHHIKIWDAWWRGFYKPFHKYNQIFADGSIVERKLYSMRMAKKIASDWASLLLNEKTKLAIDDKESQTFVCGAPDEEGAGGVFGTTKYWDNANKTVERAFATGTGAIVTMVDGMAVSKSGTVLSTPDATIRFCYPDAMHIIPISARGDEITEAAFVFETVEKGIPCAIINTHELTKTGTYRIKNECFREWNGTFEEAALPNGVSEEWDTKSKYPFFAIIRPNEVNNVECNNGLGMSVYSDAIDNLQGVDLAFNNFCRDLYLGGKKVFYNKELVRTMQGEDGRAVTIAPDDVMQQLFTLVDNEINMDEQSLVHEFNPSLRTEENKDAVQAQLDYLSFKVGFGTKHYQFNAGSVVTATQYTGDKQDLIQNASKHSLAIEDALKETVRSVLWIGKNVMGQPVNPDAKIKVTFDDGYIIDDETKRLHDKEDVRDGIMQRWEYRVKHYNEDAETARSIIGDQPTDDELMGF